MKKQPIFFFLLISLALFGQKKNIDQNLLAVEGYDLVSYFIQDHPEKGKEAFALNWEGVRYLFSSLENKMLFNENPSQYLPAYGGWCAYAMAKGREVEINPEAYHIQQGQLHLFYKTKWIDTQAKWIKDHVTFKQKADQVWAKKMSGNN